MRIAVNALNLPRNLAGIGFYVRMLAEHLLRLDPSLKITVFTNREAAQGLADLKGVDLRPVAARSVLAKSLWQVTALPFKLKGFDLVHSVGNVGLPFCPLPQVLTIHDLSQRAVPERFSPAKRAWLNFGQTWSSYSVREVVTDSEATRADLLRYHPRYEARTVTVACASKYPIDRGDPGRAEGFLFVGTLEPGKRLDWAIEAVARLRREHGIVKKLSIVGARGWKQTGLPDLIERLEVGGQLDFLGYLDDEELRQRYRSAECLIFPSIYEGFGLPILEAQSQGCPVVSADNSSLREIGGDAGCHYFPTSDRDALLAILLRSQQRQEEFRSSREAGYANCARFSWHATAEGTLAAYKRVLANR